jgi:hypothetical protein
MAEVLDLPEPLLAAIIADRGAKTKRANLELVGEDDEGAASNCICHLVKSGIDQVILKDDGDFFCKVISRDVTFLLKVSALMKNDDKGLFLRDASDAAVAHLRALKANETRWDGIDDCCKRSLVLSPGYLKLVDTQPELIEYLKVAGNWGQSDFPTQAFWKRIACWTKLWAPMRVLTNVVRRKLSPKCRWCVRSFSN